MVSVLEQTTYFGLQGGKWTSASAPPPKQSELQIGAGSQIKLQAADAEKPGAGWGALCVNFCSSAGSSLVLGHFEAQPGGTAWTFPHTGLDALDLTGGFVGHNAHVTPFALKAEGNSPEGSVVWIGAQGSVDFHPYEVIARYDRTTGTVTNSWCSVPETIENNCAEELGAAVVPDAVFPKEKAAVALENESVHVFSHERWSTAPAPGYTGEGEIAAQHEGGDAFSSAAEGWLGGTNALGRWSPEAGATGLTSVARSRPLHADEHRTTSRQ